MKRMDGAAGEPFTGITPQLSARFQRPTAMTLHTLYQADVSTPSFIDPHSKLATFNVYVWVHNVRVQKMQAFPYSCEMLNSSYTTSLFPTLFVCSSGLVFPYSSYFNMHNGSRVVYLQQEKIPPYLSKKREPFAQQQYDTLPGQ